jgi:glucose-6-phosphate dehydrogenase assembly protein OpcA
MAKSVTTRLWKRCPPAAIEDELASLWRDAGRDGHVSRALMANLVVFRGCVAAEPRELAAAIEGVPLEEVVSQHPSRLIVLHHADHDDLRRPIEAGVGVLMFGVPPLRLGVDAIAVRSSCAERSLPSIVRRLALGDVPTSIWWTDDLSATVPLESVVGMGRQLVFDSRRWRDVRNGFLTLGTLAAHPDAPDLADVNWRRLLGIRQALAHAAAALDVDARPAPVRLRIRHRPGETALSWLLAGWFCSRLGRDAVTAWPVDIEEVRNGDEVMAVDVGAPDTAAAITAVMNNQRVVVRGARVRAPFTVAVARESDADAVAAELRSLMVDGCLRDALAAIAARLTSSATP